MNWEFSGFLGDIDREKIGIQMICLYVWNGMDWTGMACNVCIYTYVYMYSG